METNISPVIIVPVLAEDCNPVPSSLGKEECWVGVDPGSVRCGIAVADLSATLASPLAVLETEPRISLAARLVTCLGWRSLRGLAVGLPLDQHGGEGKATELARGIGDMLADELSCKVYYVDERFTTKEMTSRRREAGRSGRQIKAEIDAWAAASILQGFLDRLGREGIPR